MGETMRAGQLQTVTRLRDAARIAHRLTRAYSELAKRGRLGQLTAWAAYPLMWMAYVGITSIEANSTVHCGVASLIAPNPFARPRRRLWRGVLCLLLLAVGVAELLTRPFDLRIAVHTIGGLCVTAWAIEMVTVWRATGKTGPLKATQKHVRSTVTGPVVRGGTFAAWPHPSKQFGPLLDNVIAELRRDGVNLLVQARDDELVATYLRHGAVQLNPSHPRHLVWLAS